MADEDQTSKETTELSDVEKLALQQTQASKRYPTTRGVPAKESLWLDDIRKRRDDWKYHKKVRLELPQLIQIVFPKYFQPKYHEIALNFMHILLEKGELRGADTAKFISENNYSKATIYNVILPRLRKVGMIRTEREEFAQQRSRQKYYRKIIQPSKQFSIFFGKIAEEYETLLDTAEANRPQKTLDVAEKK